MLSGAVNAGRADSAEASSPELVLVDAALALRARDRLDEPEDTLARLERDLAHRRLTVRTTSFEAPSRGSKAAAQPASGRRPARRSRQLSVGAAVAATCAGALLLGFQVNLRGVPAGADSFEVETVQQPAKQGQSATTDTLPSPSQTGRAKKRAARPRTTTPPKAKRTATPPRAATKPVRSEQPAARRFAWAPVPAASGYRVEFFRNDVRIYSAATTQPQFALPARWTFRGRVYSLSPGKYRWYVWPVVGELRQPRATVQAELVVP